MVSLRKINGNYYTYFYDSSRDPKRKSYPLRVSLKSAAEKLKHPTKRFKFFVRKAKPRTGSACASTPCATPARHGLP
jgi:hypothetical protein